MFFKTTCKTIYGLGQDIQVTVTPKQKWTLESENERIVILSRKNVSLVTSKNDFAERWTKA